VTRANTAFCGVRPGSCSYTNPSDGAASPPYRFYPDVTLPDWLVTNQLGWRGLPLQVPRGEKTVRIVFVVHRRPSMAIICRFPILNCLATG